VPLKFAVVFDSRSCTVSKSMATVVLAAMILMDGSGMLKASMTFSIASKVSGHRRRPGTIESTGFDILSQHKLSAFQATLADQLRLHTADEWSKSDPWYGCPGSRISAEDTKESREVLLTGCFSQVSI
jgi:hypothetical protein